MIALQINLFDLSLKIFIIHYNIIDKNYNNYIIKIPVHVVVEQVIQQQDVQLVF